MRNICGHLDALDQEEGVLATRKKILLKYW